MNNIHAHLYNENPKIYLGDEEINFSNYKYRALNLGIDLRIYMRDEQLELIFDEIDLALHDKIQSVLEDDIYKLEADLKECKELLEQYEEHAIAMRIGH